jgi:hypothetical protein
MKRQYVSRFILAMIAVVMVGSVIPFVLPTLYLETETGKFEGEIITLESGETFIIEKVETLCLALFCSTKIWGKSEVNLPADGVYQYGYRFGKVLWVKDGEREVWSYERSLRLFLEAARAQSSVPFPIVSNSFSMEYSGLTFVEDG